MKPGTSLTGRTNGGQRNTGALAIAALSALVASAPQDVQAATYRAGPGEYTKAVRALRPGDRLLLEPGDYTAGLQVHSLHGTRERPIQIGARDPQRKPRFLARNRHNTVSIVDSEFVEIADLLLEGGGKFVDGVKAEGHAHYAHHITVRNLRIVGHGADQQIVGISTKCPAWGWVIRDNVIVGAGTGMYLGNSDGSAPFVDGLIEGNVIRDTIGYNLQIKHQKIRPALSGMPTAPSSTIIRGNVFIKRANASVGELARPNLLVGHFPPSGPGVDDTYVIYGNSFLLNPTEALFQGEGNIAFYNNVLVNPQGSAVHIQPHKAVPGRVDVFFNTVLARDEGIRIVGGDPAKSQRIWANIVFAKQPIAGPQQSNNVTGQWDEAGSVLRAPYEKVTRLDLRPRPGTLPVIAAPGLIEAAYPDSRLDFAGLQRKKIVPGAFDYAEGKPPSLQQPRGIAR